MWPFKKNNSESIINELIANHEKEIVDAVNSVSSGIRAKIASAISGGYDGADTLHNIYLDYGYPDSLEFSHFWNMYRRFGIAKIVVDLPTDISWLNHPEIESDNVQFLRDAGILIDDLRLWQRLKGLDTRQRVGRYAGLFMRLRDGKSPDEPITGSLNGVGALVQMVPLYEGQLKVSSVDTDPVSDTYSQPTMYQFSGQGDGARNEDINGSFQIHPDRVIIAAEGADNGGIYGIPSLEACYNSLMDLRKIIGAGGEGFYKNAAQNIVFDLKDAASAKVNQKILDRFNEHYDDFAHNRSRRAMWTPGMSATTLSSDLVTPKDFFNNALNDVAAASKIPATILIGQQTGRLASQEDSRGFLSGINSRNNNFVNGMITDTLDWCIKYGILPTADYEIEFEDLLAMSDEQRLGNAFKLADTNTKQFQSGGDIPFTGAEIREAAGYEPGGEIEPDGETDMDDLDDE